MATDAHDNSIFQTAIRIVDAMLNDSSNYDSLFQVLSLLCLIAIVNRHYSQNTALSPAPSIASPIQKIAGELLKSNGSSSAGPVGGSAPTDMLMTLLPLLNNPQVKSKLNPANIGTLLSLFNNLNLGGAKNDTIASTTTTSEKHLADEKKEAPVIADPAATPTNTEKDAIDIPDQADRKPQSNNLNWKNKNLS